MRYVSEAVVPGGRASELIPYLKNIGCVDLSARITSVSGSKLVPLQPGREHDAEELGLKVVSGPAYSEASRPPMEYISNALSGLPDGLLALLPSKWELIGDTVVLKMDSRLGPYGAEIGSVYAEVLGCRTVLADVSGVSGEFREPDMTVLFGVPGESIKLENGIKYLFDPTKVMFASGNLAERKRMKDLDCSGETVVDMFAGIGYFSLPLAKFSGARRVFSCEKNLQSYRFLVKNLALNEITNIVPLLGDNRSLLGRHFADRVLMGYVQTTSGFVPKALELVRPGGLIHYHDTFFTGKQSDGVRAVFDRYCGEDNYEVLSLREVKSFAPSVSHYVADIRVLHLHRFP